MFLYTLIGASTLFRPGPRILFLRGGGGITLKAQSLIFAFGVIFMHPIINVDVDPCID